MPERLTSRERVRLAIAHQEPDRVPVHDSPWPATVTRWRQEGLPEAQDPADLFNFDIRGFGVDLTPRFPIRVVEENDEYIVSTTAHGGKRRNHRDFSTTPEVIESPIKTKDDWPAIKERLRPDFKRLDWASIYANTLRWREEGRYVVLSAGCGYDNLQRYVRSEDLLAFMATDPEFVKEMNDTFADLALASLDLVARERIPLDALWLYNDMAYRNGLLFSPTMYREIIKPADVRLYARAHELGLQTLLHCCGCVKELIPDLIDAGLDCLQPLEVKAGMDLRELKPKFGRDLAFFGGIDVRLMEHPDPAKIEAEIREKFRAAKPGGGYLYHSDHSIPKDVSFERYQLVMRLVSECGRYA